VLILVVALGCASNSDAYAPPATCFSTPLPATPIAPTFTLDIFFVSDHARATIWRQNCQDGSGQAAILLRLTAVTAAPFVCSVDVLVIQNGIQRSGQISTATAIPQSFCADLFAPTTVVLFTDVGQPFDPTAAFTLIYDGIPQTSVEIPAAGPPPPPSTTPATLTVHALGCTTCGPGQTLGFEVHVTNPGPPMLVELKTGARLPGGIVVRILGRHEDEVIGSGVTVIPLFSGLVLPHGTPPGAYAIEAALLEPELGVTLSRHSVALTLVP
jgi:hypothetical protein